MKKFILIFLLLSISTFAQTVPTEDLEEGIYDDIGNVKLEGGPGLTPDSNFYFLESLVESVLVGNNPEAALRYKQEKVLEVEEMIKSGNKEAAEKALEGMEKYNEILRKEVTPEIERKVRESSKATKTVLQSLELNEEWEELQERIEENIKTEDKIALAAKVSHKIKELCEALSQLDPLEYSKVCKTDNDAPQWKKDLDKKLTKEQEKEAKEFFKIMSQCFNELANCRCNDISIKPFAEKCSIIAPLAAKCETGDNVACQEMEEIEDPIELLPDYLQDVLLELEDDYRDARYDLRMPTECIKEGAVTKEACMKIMFKIHAPPECQEALERGEIDPKNEREARESCERIIFEHEAPDECREAGVKNREECERLMFKLDAPQECLDAGLTGSGRDDWNKCELIRFKLDAPEECLAAGLTGEGRNDWKECDAIRFKLEAAQECLDAGLDGTGRDDWNKCNAIQFKLEAPEECVRAGLDGTGRNDWQKCQQIQFKAEAPPECLAAGFDGSGRNDWDKCNQIKDQAERQDREACNGDYICDGKYCECRQYQNYNDHREEVESDSSTEDQDSTQTESETHTEEGTQDSTETNTETDSDSSETNDSSDESATETTDSQDTTESSTETTSQDTTSEETDSTGDSITGSVITEVTVVDKWADFWRKFIGK